MSALQRRFDVTELGAVGDGVHDDWAACQEALTRAGAVNGSVFVPAGRYLLKNTLVRLACTTQVAIHGDGANVSVFVVDAPNVDALMLEFQQDNVAQPWGLNLRDIGFEVGLGANGRAGTAIKVSYGNPTITSDHYRPSTTLRGVTIASSPAGAWAGGVDITSAWNVMMDDVYISGDSAAGNWNAMSGSGIVFRRMCVNAHLTNVRCNFWQTGFIYLTEGGSNTEGLYFANCAIVAVQRGVWIIGNRDATPPRMSTLTWTGGIIECRVGGVEGGTAAFHLVSVWTALISGAQLLAETLDALHETYGVFLDNCAGVVLTGCDVNAWKVGLYTVGECRAINSHGNTYTNCARQNVFNPGTVDSSSYGHVLFNDAPANEDPAGVNDLGWQSGV